MNNIASVLAQRSYGFIGAGNMTQSVVKALIESKLIPKEKVWVTNRTERKLNKLVEETGVNTFKNNEELVDQCDVVFVSVKPQDLYSCLEPIASSFGEHHTVVSFAAGISLATLKKLLPQVEKIVRLIPNTPAKLREAVVGYSLIEEREDLSVFIEDLFSPMGLVMKVEEGDELEALTVACSSGVGFLFEIMIYWQEWLEEHGFAPEKAKALTIKTFFGASMLASKSETTSLIELQKKVVSQKGVTAAGLDSMRELEVERLLRYSFEKAVLRDRELGKTLV